MSPFDLPATDGAGNGKAVKVEPKWKAKTAAARGGR